MDVMFMPREETPGSVSSSTASSLSANGNNANGSAVLPVAAPVDGQVTASPTESLGGGSSGGGVMTGGTDSGLVSPVPAAPIQVAKCPACMESFVHPKVLACFHTFCKPCLEKLVDAPARIICPTCHAETQLCPDLGVDSLLTDYAISNMQDAAVLQANNSSAPSCTGCKSKDSNAVAHCFDCTNFLCANCVMAHQYMHCFEGHRVVDLSELDSKALERERPVKCLQHKTEALKFFCFTCNVPVCAVCTSTDHLRTQHQYEPIPDIGQGQIDYLQQMLDQARVKQRTLVHNFKSLDNNCQHLQIAYNKAQQDITDTAALLVAMIEEQRNNALRDLETAYNSKQMSLNLLDKKVHSTMEKLCQTIEFTGRLLKHASPAEILVFKKLLETRLQAILNFNPDLNLLGHQDMEFVSNPTAARAAIVSSFGFIRQSSDLQLVNRQPPIARPVSSTSLNSAPSQQSLLSNPMSSALTIPSGGFMNGVGSSDMAFGSAPAGSALRSFSPAAAAMATNKFDAIGSVAIGGSSGPNMESPSFPAMVPDYGSYERWSNASSDIYQIGNDPYYGSSIDSQVVDLSTKMAGMPGFPPKSQIKRHKMIYHCKFGEFGVMEGQFTEPSGVAVTLQGDVVVADTNNHRIQVFDKEGRFKFQFGECGKRDGQLLYPNRVAVNRLTGDIIVTERSPTHQIQIYNQYGQFLRKFGANILQHPRGVTVDHKGRIVIVECKVMRVLIFDMFGNVLQKFGCSKYLEFPNGVCTSDKQEIFISDNRAHAIKVFNYEGTFLRQIGGEGVTNYPIGVGVNHAGELVVADNHNNFNLTIFQTDGTLLNALESKVKHAQCFDVALVDDGSVVLASKDYRLYVYRYIQGPQTPI